MRDYIINELPYRPIIRIERLGEDVKKHIVSVATRQLLSEGWQPHDPRHANRHPMGNTDNPPRLVLQLIAYKAIRELELSGHPPTRNSDDIRRWLFTLPDEALLLVFRECLERVN